MLYPKNKSVKLENSLFENPTSEYRGAPFWSWNCKLSKEIIEKQISYLKEMGFGGFHMHSRTGMATEYLGDEFMELVKTCVKKAENENMLVIIKIFYRPLFLGMKKAEIFHLLSVYIQL
jgi:hypothetical protein